MLEHEIISSRRQNALDRSDEMPRELRECVHEYGYAIVHACLDNGVKRPGQIHQLVHEIWEGARQPSQRRERLGMLDWVLLQAGAQISAATLLRILAGNSMAIVPLMPSTAMVAASMAEVSGFNVRVTKTEKHRRRLTAAVKAGFDHLRPQLLATRAPLASEGKG